jgi:hypothetical protein
MEESFVERSAHTMSSFFGIIEDMVRREEVQGLREIMGEIDREEGLTV